MTSEKTSTKFGSTQGLPFDLLCQLYTEGKEAAQALIKSNESSESLVSAIEDYFNSVNLTLREIAKHIANKQD